MTRSPPGRTGGAARRWRIAAWAASLALLVTAILADRAGAAAARTTASAPKSQGAASTQVGPPGRPIAADGGRIAWLAWAVPGRGAMLWVLGLEPQPGTLRAVAALGSVPTHLAGDERRAVALFAPIGGVSGSTALGAARTRLRPLREVTLRPGPAGLADMRPLTWLPGDGEILGLASAGSVVAALHREPSGATRLLVLQRAELQAIDVPFQGTPGTRMDLLGVGGRLVLVERPPAGEASLWRLVEPVSADLPASWEREAAPALAMDDQLRTADRHLIALRPARGASPSARGGLEALLVRAGTLVPVGTLDAPADEDALTVGLGPALARVWDIGGTAPRPSLSILSLTGQRIYDGEARTPAPVRTRDLEILALALVSVAIGVALFILWPERLRESPVVLPEGWVLARPERRLAAACLDVGLALALSALITWRPLADFLDVPALMDGRRALWPLGLWAGVFVTMTGVGEAWWGRTPGKALCACRVVTRRGARAGAWRGLGRNAVKVLCPPLAIAAWLTPGQAHAGALGTLVIELRRADPGHPPDVSPDQGSEG